MPAFRPKKRILFTVVVVAVLLSALLMLPRVGRYLSTQILYELVASETNGYYQLDFDRLDINLWQGLITVAGVRLHPDSTRDFAARGLPNLYSLELDELVFNVESTSRVLFNRELLIERVRAINPRMHVFHDKEAGSESFSLQTGNLYKEISDYLNVFRVDHLNLENGRFQHYPSLFRLSSIDFLLQNLLVESTSRPDERFFTENLELEIRDQHFALRDSIHEVSFNRFLLSTADSVLTFDSLRIRPVALPRKRFNPDSNYVIYDIAIPRLTLKGVDYFSAYQQDYLKVKELAFNDSRIDVDAETYIDPRRKAKKTNSLQSQLIEVFKQVQVGKLRLINTRLDIKTNQEYNFNFQDLETERADIVLYDIHLDSTNYRFGRDSQFFQDIDIIIKDYSAFLPDSIHRVEFDLLTMSSFDSTFIFEGFSIDHHTNDSTLSDLYSVDLPLFSLHGIDYRALARKEVVIDKVELRRPGIIIEQVEANKTVDTATVDKLYELFKDDYHTIRIKEVLIDNGQLLWDPTLSVNEFDSHISGFRIDGQTRSWHDLYDRMDLDMLGFLYENDSNHIEVQRVTTDSTLKRFLLSDIELEYVDETMAVTGSVGALQPVGIQLDSILTGAMVFDSLSITDPKITIRLKQSEERRNFETRHDRYLSITNGQLEIISEDSSLYQVDSHEVYLKIGQNNHLYSSRLSDITIHSIDVGHQVTISSMSMDQAGDLIMEKIKIDPIDSVSTGPFSLATDVPYLNLHGIDQAAIWEENKLKADSMLIGISNTTASLGEMKLGGDSSLLDRDLELEVGKVELQCGRFNYKNNSQGPFQELLFPSAEITVQDFHYPDHSLIDDSMLLHAGGVKIEIDSIRPTMANVDSIFVRRVSYNLEDQRLVADNLLFQNENATASSFQVQAINPDFQALIEQQLLLADTLLIDQPQILITTPFDQGETNTEVYNQQLELDFLAASDYNVQIRDTAKQVTYALGTGNLYMNDLSSASSFSLESVITDQKAISIEGGGMSIPLDDGYTLSVERYDLQLPENRLGLSEVHLTSDMTPEVYSSRLPEQSNWYNINAQEISLKGIDFERWYTDNHYHIRKTDLIGIDIQVYLDKSIPRPQNLQRNLPQTLLRDMDRQVQLDTITLTGDITYREKPELNEEIGEISFNDLQTELTHVINTDDASTHDMRLEAKGILLNSGLFEAVAIFDLDDRKDRFSLVGEISNLPLDSLNKILRPLANVNIRSGHSKQIWFNIMANNELAEGQMKMNYSDLKVQILNPETHDTHGLGQGLKTFFANTFVVKKRNPAFLFLRDGTIFYERDPSRAIFNYWGKSLLSGAVSSIGIHRSDKAKRKYDKGTHDP